MSGLQYSDVVENQQGLTREQLASQTQDATVAAPTDLNALKTQLNSFQNQTFADSSGDAPMRSSSTLQGQIDSASADYETAFSNYKSLVDKYNSIQAPNFYDIFTQLRNDQGIPQLNDQYAAVDAQRNDLPYTVRAASGNAGVETESQLGQNIDQKDIPLGIQEKNILTRLGLANDFVNNALQLKEHDATAASDAVSKAIELANNGVSLASSHLSTLRQQQQDERSRANDTLNSILTLTKGSTWDQLDPQTQAVITNAAANSSLTLDAIKKAMVNNVNSDTQIVEVNGRKVLINSHTGAAIKDLGAAPSSTTPGITPTGSSYIVNAPTDAAVKQIIAANPGEWGHAADAIDAKFGAGTATKYDSWLKAVYQNGQSVSTLSSGSVPTSLQPYFHTSANGTGYVDLSKVGTSKTAIALAQQAAANGLKVITNTNDASDLTNIDNALANIGTMSGVFTALAQPSVASRFLNNLGLTKAAVTFQTDPQKAASSALNDAALDLLKAISGIQGFRGNQAAIDQIKSALPTIYDTQATAQQKLSYVTQLIQNRENALLGTSTSKTSSSSSANQITTPDGAVWRVNSDGSYTRIQ